MNKKSNLTLLLLLCSLTFALISCDSKNYSASDCEQFSMDSFKGMPKAAKLYQDHCQNIEIKYTKEKCQKALNDLILSGDYNGVLKKHGKPVSGCFTEKDLRTFRK